ncbi:MAG TPA: hypothetical protein VKQ72_03870, partial [Aggregatilineales bacterium]|nr:hypothetical protein [Aggregatilineales bacterium]
MTKAAYLEIMDGYGYWNDFTADLLGADVKVGFDDSNLWQSNKRMPPPGRMTLRLNNSARKYTPPQDTPKFADTMVPWRRCRLRMGTPSLGNCLRMTSSGIGAPGTSLNANTGNAGTANISVNGGNVIERAQAFVTTGGVLSAISFATPNAGISITWSVYADNGGQPGNSLAGGIVTSISGTNTIIIGGALFVPSGTVLWVSVKAPNTATTNIYTSNGIKTYAAGPIYSNTNNAGWALHTVSGNYQFSIALNPQGTTVQQVVALSGNVGDVLTFSLDHRAQWDSQYNLLGLQIVTSAESSPVTVLSSTNKYKSRSVSFTATANFTSVTVHVCAAHNTAALNSVYHEIRNGSLTRNGGANLLTNANFSSGALSPWTEASQLDIALFGKEKYDTDVQLRGAAHPGGSASQTTTPNLTVLGGNGANNQQIVQTFQVTDGQLSQIQINFGPNVGTPLGTVTWELWLANPSSANTVAYMGFQKLASGTFTPFPSQLNIVNIVNGPLLYASTEYMLALYATTPQSGANAWQVQNSSSDVYASGKLGTAPGNGNVGASAGNPNGPNWADTGFDLAFNMTTTATLVKDKLAQNFVVFTPQSVNAVNLWMAKVGVPGGTLTLRIETDNNGQPSGTLLNANA